MTTAMYPFNHPTALHQADPEIARHIEAELQRQRTTIELIASENVVSAPVLLAQGSVLTNKYAEGYPHKRYYGGCEHVDAVEELAIARVKQLFQCGYANVQPHSGSQANQAAFLALLQPGDTILGMSMNAGGHLTHGSSVNLSGKWFRAVSYGVDTETGYMDYNMIEAIARKEQPKLIIAGYSAYPRALDFAAFRTIADAVGAYLMVDMAHIAGLIATGAHPSPLPYADVVTSTTHKTLRGPRGGLILTNHETIAKQCNTAIFPGLQGGPLMHVIAAKAVAFAEALQPSFRTYIDHVVGNARAMAAGLMERGYRLVTSGTDNHLMLVDLSSTPVTGKRAEHILEACGLTCNKNTVPGETRSPFVTSGIRLGTPAATSRGFTEVSFKEVAHCIADVLDAMARSPEDDGAVLRETASVRTQVAALCQQFPLMQEV